MRAGERFALIARTVMATSLVWVAGIGVYLLRPDAPVEKTAIYRGQGLLEAAPPAIPRDGALVIPVSGIRADQLVDTFSQARDGGVRPHDAIDIMAPEGTPVIAAAPGRVEKLFFSNTGGNTVYVRTGDGRWIDYYAHMQSYAPGLAEGQTVREGQVIGTVGATGNADPATPHLHFAIFSAGPGAVWSQPGPAVNPYPLLTTRR